MGLEFMTQDPHDPVVMPLAVNAAGFTLDAFLAEAASPIAANCAFVKRKHAQINPVQVELSESPRKHHPHNGTTDAAAEFLLA